MKKIPIMKAINELISYVLKMDLNLLNKELLKENLLSKIIYFDKLESTNKYAKENNLDDNTLVITSHQTGGIGRFGRPWESLPGKNLTFSIVKRFDIGIDEIHLVNFYSSYILYETIKCFIPDNQRKSVTLKWPNDILFNEKKLAGFLLDVKDLKKDFKKFIIGTGLNINQKIFTPELNLKATSLLLEIKSEIRPEEFLIAFINFFFEKLSLIKNKEDLMRKWNSNSKIEGKKIIFKMLQDSHEQSATVLGIDNDGGLKLMFNDGIKSKFYSGEISLIY
ncbi:MAG: biotin--[acetyl-CoA-carboxylase] ligase [Bacteroidota bacterium]|nr:biotin--[acetyl-CoA-carboxylase] ligase [Bacteroidota bacterium]